MHILLSNGKITIICHMFWALSVNSPLGSKKVPAREIMLMHNSNFLSATMMASECKQMKRVPSCGAYGTVSSRIILSSWSLSDSR
mmetsp:Transcript_31701/g.51285  ORF Transcript_31701/g.51285 Transcript_31701/m.51285 type:complete len:85 (+) Transcript_31701:2494-2748(+)